MLKLVKLFCLVGIKLKKTSIFSQNPHSLHNLTILYTSFDSKKIKLVGNESQRAMIVQFCLTHQNYKNVFGPNYHTKNNSETSHLLNIALLVPFLFAYIHHLSPLPTNFSE